MFTKIYTHLDRTGNEILPRETIKSDIITVTVSFQYQYV